MVGTDDGRALGIPCGVPLICHPAKVGSSVVIQAETAARPFSTDATRTTALTNSVRNKHED
jgi:hypothetical protein